MQQSRVILADKHANLLGGICRLLEDEGKTIVMVADKKSLYDALENFNPDVVVVDHSFLSSRGTTSRETNIAWVLKKDFPKLKIIILSNHDDKSAIDDAVASGIEGFVLKPRAVIDLIPALREVLQGRKYIRPTMNDI